MYSIHDLIPIAPMKPLKLAYLGWPLPAGFPSPADDFQIESLDLTTLLVPRPVSTFLWRVGGTSMIEAGIFDGDIIVVDRSLRPAHGDIVVAQVDNAFTVKYLHRRNGSFRLAPANPTFPEIIPGEGQEVLIVGVLTASIKQFRQSSGS